MKKSMAFFLMTAMLSTMLAGCGGTSNQSSTPDSSTASSTDTETSSVNATGLPIVNEPLTLKVMAQADAPNSVDYENMLYWQMVAEATGIQPEWTVSKGDEWTQKKNLMYASGEYPDIILSGTTIDDEEKYGVQQGILIPVGEYLTEEYMPNLSGLLDTRPEFKKQITATDGNIYSFPKCWEIGYDSSGHFFINQKWLDTLNLEVPETIDELYTVLQAFATQDPNGNGENDEIPFELMFKDGTTGLCNLNGLFGQLDTTDHLILENDKVIFSAAQDTYRTTMEWVNQAYTEGLIDPEAFSHDLNTYYAKIKGGNVGCFIGWRLTDMAHSYEGMENDYICIDPPAAEGVTPVWNNTPSGATIGGAAITVTNEHVVESVRWIDYQMTPDMGFQARNGVLGTYQELDENGKFVAMNKPDGTPYTNEELMAQAPGPGGLFFLTSDAIQEKYNLTSYHLEKYPYCDQYRPYLVEQPASLISWGRLSQQDQDTKARLATDINKFVDESTMQFISKGVTDSSWQTYLDTLQSMKLDEYIALNQKAYDTYNAN